MGNYDKFLSNIIKCEKYYKVSPSEYATNLREVYKKNLSFWYKKILPKEKADELIISTENDYSKIWEEHCSLCFCLINKNTVEDCYVSQDEITWLCNNCYETILRVHKN